MPRKNPALERVHRELLTPFVLARAKHLHEKQRPYFELWRKLKKVEFLQDGTPFKITNDLGVRLSACTHVMGLNKPLILVSDLLSPEERQQVAMHELIEWTHASSEATLKAAHEKAERSENPKLKESILQLRNWFAERAAEMNFKGTEKLTRKDYLEWLKKQGKK
jgi:hypothetical protein